MVAKTFETISNKFRSSIFSPPHFIRDHGLTDVLTLYKTKSNVPQDDLYLIETVSRGRVSARIVHVRDDNRSSTSSLIPLPLPLSYLACARQVDDELLEFTQFKTNTSREWVTGGAVMTRRCQLPQILWALKFITDAVTTIMSVSRPNWDRATTLRGHPTRLVPRPTNPRNSPRKEMSYD
ncbi:hypothetical protein J6590_010673 [Homalodisca vitripennis]|nr:hypothetical protein J6590_010673 [Homalodisca vitripennis]